MLPSQLFNTFECPDSLSFAEAHTLPVPISVRLNIDKPAPIFTENKPVPWCKTGKYLTCRPSFTLDPFFQAGCYYVQEASSMFLDFAFKHIAQGHENWRILDLCAAPGGKSTLLASAISKDSLLVANEVIKGRVFSLVENLNKWGLSNTFVTNNDAAHFGERLPNFFDALVIDAPCSGSGLFRKDASAINEWSVGNVMLCSQRQQRIIADAWNSLRLGGYLLYSTCSYSEAENEAIADWLLNNFEVETVQIPVPTTWGIVETNSPKYGAFGYRFYPNKLQGEGFFMAVFRKKSGEEAFSFRKQKVEPNKNQKHEKNILQTWIPSLDIFLWFEKNEDYFLLQKQHKEAFGVLQKNLYIKKAGIWLGQLTKKELIPAHELAVSTVLTKDIQGYELSENEVLKYLRREDFMPQTDFLGWVLMQCQGFGLGWAKILPNRMNNYYPKELRILK